MTFLEIFNQARGYPSRLWIVCFFAYALSQMDLALWSYALPLIRIDFGLSVTEVGLLTGLPFAVGGVGLVLLSFWADRHGRPRTLALASVSSAAFVATQAAAPGVMVLGLVRACSIATGGLLYPITGALMAEEAPARIRGLMTGMLQVAYPAGWFLASLLAVLLLERFGWRVLFVISLSSIPFVLVIRRVVRESSRQIGAHGTAISARFGELFRAGRARRTATLMIAQYLYAIAYASAFTFSPMYFHVAHGQDIGSTAILVGLGNLFGVIGYCLAAWVGEFHVTRRTTTVLWTASAAAIFAVFLVIPQSFWSMAALFSLMAVFLLGTAAVKFAYIAESFPTPLRATGIALCGSLPIQLGQATGPPLVGWLSDTAGWGIAMAVGGPVPLLASALLFLLLKPVPSGLDIDEVQRRLDD